MKGNPTSKKAHIRKRKVSALMQNANALGCFCLLCMGWYNWSSFPFYHQDLTHNQPTSQSAWNVVPTATKSGIEPHPSVHPSWRRVLRLCFYERSNTLDAALLYDGRQMPSLLLPLYFEPRVPPCSYLFQSLICAEPWEETPYGILKSETSHRCIF
ncbi:hypothetical protein F4782DRAFT_417492 [Xylaria castorea]|nr:hypothetical protein F4782DRAFT_417492 [Xylaria castorea]